ncbi:MAG: hypothetical protein JWQ06_2347 [Mucilaginibacter sp.]|nr:hypothetical protein [Mucilaginibacter sp.]
MQTNQVKLFVVGFPREMDEMQLAQLFSPYGDIGLLTIVRDQQNGRSKGYGFVHMKDQSGAEQAINALNGLQFGQRKLEVRIADQQPAPAVHQVVPQRLVQPGRETSAPVKKKRPRLPK